MKNNLTFGYFFSINLLCCSVISSCETEKLNPITTNFMNNLDEEAKTIENMQSAYKDEKNATAKYEAYSKKADAEGFHKIAILYSAVSTAENFHARNHKLVIEDAGSVVPEFMTTYKVKSTKENLIEDINGEAYEAKTMYPNFIKMAKKANNQLAILSISYAMKTEKKHKLFFEKASKALIENELNNLPSHYFVCPDCGNTYENIAPKHCDFSMTSGDKFIKF